jgi:hypothetical protein
MKYRCHFRLQIHLDHHLRHTIRYGRYTQPPGSPITLGNIYGANRRREITPRGHSIPDFIQIVFKINLKIFNRLPIDSHRTLVCLYPSKGFSNHMLGNNEWLCFSHRLLPSLVDHVTKTRQYNPFVPSTLHGLHNYYGLFRPRVSLWYSHAHGASTCVSPLASRRQVPTFRTKA